MNYIDTFASLIQHNRKNQKISNVKGIVFFSVLGAVICGTAASLLIKNHNKKTTNVVFNKPEDNNKDIDIKKDEIKEILENETPESLGNVGIAMENALQDIETENQNTNEVTSR